MRERIERLREEAESGIRSATSLKELDEWRVRLLGRKG
ncbi:MAG TPA: phenylalanine--tRNA ligase subunit alpha, partial [Armatimonadetes bacterium]|nr:phenylalanine--tRNA ligase subunit alpha [Armatimonadota bacterium]